jgi:hypothetical protein
MKTLQNQWPCGLAALHALLRWVEHRLGNGCGPGRVHQCIRDGSPESGKNSEAISRDGLGHDWSVSAATNENWVLNFDPYCRQSFGE